MMTPLSRLLPLALSGLLALTSFGCDSASTAPADTATPTTAAAATAELQAVANQEEPGELWRVAASVHDTLSAEQFAHMEEHLRTLSERLSEHRGMHRRGPGMGGPGMGGPGVGGPGVEGLSGLDLTEEQKEALAEIRAEYRPQIRNLMQQRRDGSISEEAFRTHMQGLRAAMREALRDVLTDAQLETLEAHRAEVQARREAARAVRAEVLGLTAEQEEQLDALRSDAEAHTLPMEDYDAWTASLAAILSEEQVELTIVHAALRAQLHARRMQEHGGPPHGRRGLHGGRLGQ
jgi:hypothetical protein